MESELEPDSEGNWLPRPAGLKCLCWKEHFFLSDTGLEET